MAPSKKSLDLAHEAGRQAMLTEPPERRTPDACPFDPRDMPEQRAAWLDGFESVLDQTPDIASLKAQLKEAKA